MFMTCTWPTLISQEIVTGDSLQMQIPGGWGAASAPNDGFHQWVHVFNKAFCTSCLKWSNSIDVRKTLGELNIGAQTNISAKLLAIISATCRTIP